MAFKLGSGVPISKNSMVTKSTNRILEILQDCPSGLSANEVADRLGATVSNVGSRLSKLAAYGIIKKTRGRIASDASPCAIYFAPTSSAPQPSHHAPHIRI